MLEIGSLVDGKYKILNEIGHGGMSVVILRLLSVLIRLGQSKR